jgi:enamine deaminase RidA (YjgF/YER057c/UK114 family)
MRGVNDADVLQRIADQGLELPPPPVPVAAYVPVVVSGGLAFVAGQVPIVDGRVLHAGLLGGEVSVEQGHEGARRAALQSLSALRAELGSFDRLRRIVQVTVYIASTPDFGDHPKVANGASELLVAVLGEEGKHARAAIGMASLPLGGCIEVVVIAEVERVAPS